jgi:hypothetical protein
LLSCGDRDGVCLTLVLVHVGMNKLNNVGTERSLHDGRESSLARLVAREGKDANKRTGRHFGMNLLKRRGGLEAMTTVLMKM